MFKHHRRTQMAVSNAEGFLAGFLGAANKDNEERRAQQAKNNDLQMKMKAKRKELVFINDYKNYESIRKLNSTLGSLTDPVARQDVLAQFHGVSPAVAQKRGLNLQAPKLPEDPRKRLDKLERENSVGRSPLTTKLRGMASNLAVTLGVKADIPPAAPAAPAAIQAPQAPQAPEALVTQGPTDEEVQATFAKPDKITSTFDAGRGQTVFTNTTKGTSYAIDIENLKKKPDEPYRVTVTSTDPETGDTVKAIQNFVNASDGTPTPVGNEAIIGAKAVTDRQQRPITLPSEAEINSNLGTFEALGLSNKESVEPTRAMLGKFQQLSREPANKDANPDELRKIAIVHTIARKVPLEQIIDGDLIGSFGIPVLNESGVFEGTIHQNYTELFKRFNDTDDPLHASAAYVKARNQIRQAYQQ